MLISEPALSIRHVPRPSDVKAISEKFLHNPQLFPVLFPVPPRRSPYERLLIKSRLKPVSIYHLVPYNFLPS